MSKGRGYFIITIIIIIIIVIIIITIILMIVFILLLLIIIIQIGKRQLYFIWLNHVLLDLNNLSKDTAFMFTFTLFSSVKLTASKNF